MNPDGDDYGSPELAKQYYNRLDVAAETKVRRLQEKQRVNLPGIEAELVKHGRKKTHWI